MQWFQAVHLGTQPLRCECAVTHHLYFVQRSLAMFAVQVRAMCTCSPDIGKPWIPGAPQDGQLEVRDLGGGGCANLVRYRMAGPPPPAAELKAAHRVLKRVARVIAPLLSGLPTIAIGSALTTVGHEPTAASGCARSIARLSGLLEVEPDL